MALDLQALINSAPKYGSTYGNRPFNSTQIDVPAFETIVITAPITIPKNKSIHLRGVGGHSSARLINATGTPYIATVEPGHRVATFENLFFDGGGLMIQGGVNQHWGANQCTFAGCKEWAIKVNGQSAVGGVFANCTFSNNVGNISIEHRQCNLITFTGCRFLVTTGPAGVRLAGSEITFRDCNFERASGRCFVHLDDQRSDSEPDRIAQAIAFDSCRFGPEFPVPEYVFVVGGFDAPTPGLIVGLQATNCSFSKAATKAVILQNAPMAGALFNQRRRTQVPVFVEAAFESLGGKHQPNTGNRFIGESIGTILGTSAQGWMGL